MKRTTFLIGIFALVAIACGTMAILQRGELNELRASARRLEELCRRERNHVQTVVPDLRSAIPDVRTHAAESFVRFYEWSATVEACLPGSKLDIGPARTCWGLEKKPECLLPVADEIAAEFDRRWAPR